ncbi:MAG: Hpt domain-containing protein [Fluviicoccus sp.]|uniref:Hpt domain-containing protein n=1 Tax=Fluviicoccus sp. TaxID=2003552 RepID=UPI0027224969|nr:Hpt domain-containing protein [Fluviicoccus sp.]MDO8328991.1 Hpt domain-containing protein [Fluviicoccus sp.]
MHLDALQLNELKEVLEGEFKVLVETYLQDARLRLQLIRQAFQANDNNGGRQAAHSLKGASANLGANDLTALCEKLELAAKAGGLADCEALIEAVEAEFSIVDRELRKLVD